MRTYTAEMEAQAVTLASDLIIITAPATMVLCITRAWVGQDGGVVSEMGRWAIKRSSTTNAGSACGIAPKEVGEQAATFTATYLPSNNTLASNIMGPRVFNWVVGDEWVPSPEERIWIPPSGKVVLKLLAAPSGSKTVTAGAEVIEIG